jgi:mRNA interferase MazF
MEIKLGDIFWLNQEGVSHPHVIIKVSEPDDTLVVCSLTTNMKKINMPGNVLLDMGEGNLEKQSIVEVSKEFTINRAQLKDYIGSLSQARVDEILNGIGFIERSFLNPKNL